MHAWVCDGHGNQLYLVCDWATGDLGPADSRQCPGCDECSQQKAASVDKTEAA